MFKTAKLAAIVPSEWQLNHWKMVKRQAPTAVHLASVYSDLWSALAYNIGMEMRNALTTTTKSDLRLAYQGKPILFDGCEPTVYCGEPYGSNSVVFAIMICDDEPEWLHEIIGTEEGDFGDNEYVFLVLPSTPAKEATATLVVPWDNERDYWEDRTPELLSNGELLRIVKAAEAAGTPAP